MTYFQHLALHRHDDFFQPFVSSLCRAQNSICICQHDVYRHMLIIIETSQMLRCASIGHALTQFVFVLNKESQASPSPSDTEIAILSELSRRPASSFNRCPAPAITQHPITFKVKTCCEAESCPKVKHKHTSGGAVFQWRHGAQCSTSQVISQSRTSVKLNRVFFHR